MDKLKVMMATEGTYPFHHGGVSTWCDILTNGLQREIDFVIYSITMNPFVAQKFNLPNNSKLIKVPLWGTEEPWEHLDISFSKFYFARKRTSEQVIKEKFLPLFIDMIDELMKYDKNPIRLGNTLFHLYKYFQNYEYKKSFKSEITWNAYKDYVLNFTKNMTSPGIYSIMQSLGWIYRFMTILNTPLPKVDVTHSAAAAFCGIPCILSKIESNTPFILTEHGVYLREQYLSLSKRGYPSFLNTFLIRMIHSIVSLNYYFADQVSPVCEYNTRWEERFGVKRENIKTIYNGVDKEQFSNKFIATKNSCPTVVSVARIDPVKDIVTLLKAAAIVKKKIKDVKFIVYGSISVQGYYDECISIRNELGLHDNFLFAGHINNISEAYLRGDIIALSSITEAFPYSVVEAMMSGKPVVSTDVGGIREAIGECGILVKPRDKEGLANGIIELLNDLELRTTIAAEARERALNYFSIDKAKKLYYESYRKLAILSKQKEITEASANLEYQKISMEKGFALFENGFFFEAIKQLRISIQYDSESAIVPVLLTKIADAYNILGEYDKAFCELEKTKVLIKVLFNNKTA